MTPLGPDRPGRVPAPGQRRLLWLVVLIAVCLRLGAGLYTYAVDPQRFLVADTASYVNVAHALRETGRFAVDASPTAEPELVRTPGYPVFLALFGQPSPASALAVVVVQVLLFGLMLVMLWRMGLLLAPPGAALIAVLLLALEPTSFVYSQKIMPEILFTFLVVAGVWAGLAYLTSERRPWSLLALVSLLLALATLVRPVTYYLIVPLALFFAAHLLVRRAGLGAVLKALVALLLPWALLIGGWQARNYAVSGDAAFSQIVSWNLLAYRAAWVQAQAEGTDFDTAHHRLVERVEAVGREQGQVAMYAEARRLGSEILARHPDLVARSLVVGLGKIFLVPATFEVWEHFGLPAGQTSPMGDWLRLDWGEWSRRWLGERPGLLAGYALNMAYLGLIYLGVLITGLAALTWRRDRFWPLALVFLVAGYILVISAGPTTYARFRHPAMPLLCLLAVAWLRALSPRLR